MGVKKNKIIKNLIQTHQRKKFNNDSSTNSEDHEEGKNQIDEKTLKRIKRKSETYKRELEHRAERYEKTKGVSMLVDTIKTTTKRLTKFQIEKYNNYLVKYPDNELLLSIQHQCQKLNSKTIF